jgi:starch-binding outer membrane protein, SusD/RagB family
MTRQMPPRRTARGAALAALAALTLAAGCGLLDVTNPNNVGEESLENPAAATPIANGAIGATTRAVNSVLDAYGTASDEMDFVGSQDFFLQLDVGNHWNPSLVSSDNGYTRVAEARWTADEAIKRLAAWDKAGQLATRADLANAYLYGAVVYTTIGDMFDDFVLSDRLTSGTPVGEANMAQMYDSAVVYLDRGLAIATALNNNTLRQQILATRARAKYGRALWPKLNPPAKYSGTPTPIASPLVNDPGAVADAQAALALIGNADFAFTVQPASTGSGTGGNNLGNDLNSRREVRIGQAYGRPDPAATNRTQVVDGQPVIVLNDPVTGAPDLALRARVNALITGGQFVTITLASARELQLILAEAALAQGNTAEFRTRINAVRAYVAGRTAWDGTTPDALTLLRHERRVNLFMQGRRLQDMYRFGERDPRWQTGSIAYNVRGCFFPITITERQSNPNTIPRPVCEGL